MHKNVLSVAAGGFAGTWSRYLLDQAVPEFSSGFPLGILLINFAGCLFLGWFLTRSSRWTRFPGEMRLLIGAGFTGSFTTFSTFTVGAVRLWDQAGIIEGALYVLLSTAGGLFLSWAGIYLGERTVRKGPKERRYS